jgi:hypothetical protein
MAMLPWRLQGDIAKGETDPLVTVFMGPERYILDADGNPTSQTFIEQNTADPVIMKLSELGSVIQPVDLQRRRKEAMQRQPAGLAGAPPAVPQK